MKLIRDEAGELYTARRRVQLDPRTAAEVDSILARRGISFGRLVRELLARYREDSGRDQVLQSLSRVREIRDLAVMLLEVQVVALRHMLSAIPLPAVGTEGRAALESRGAMAFREEFGRILSEVSKGGDVPPCVDRFYGGPGGAANKVVGGREAP